MSKAILSSAIAFFAVMTVFASAAEACISCEYTPPVVRGSTTSDSAKRVKKKNVYRSPQGRKARAAKKRTVKRKTTTKKRIVKRKSTAKKVETAKTAPIKSEMDNQNSTSSTASLGNSYVGCKTLSVGCVVTNSGPSKMTKNLGRLSVSEPNQLASDRRESPSLTRGAFENTEQQ